MEKKKKAILSCFGLQGMGTQAMLIKDFYKKQLQEYNSLLKILGIIIEDSNVYRSLDEKRVDAWSSTSNCKEFNSIIDDY